MLCGNSRAPNVIVFRKERRKGLMGFMMLPDGFYGYNSISLICAAFRLAGLAESRIIDRKKSVVTGSIFAR